MDEVEQVFKAEDFTLSVGYFDKLYKIAGVETPFSADRNEFIRSI